MWKIQDSYLLQRGAACLSICVCLKNAGIKCYHPKIVHQWTSTDIHKRRELTEIILDKIKESSNLMRLKLFSDEVFQLRWRSKRPQCFYWSVITSYWLIEKLFKSPKTMVWLLEGTLFSLVQSFSMNIFTKIPTGIFWKSFSSVLSSPKCKWAFLFARYSSSSLAKGRQHTSKEITPVGGLDPAITLPGLLAHL